MINFFMIITKKIEWDMGHRLLNHSSKCRNIHGHRYVLEASLEGDVINIEGDSSEGMVIDFGDIKKILVQEIHDKLDHSFLVWEKDYDIIKFFETQKDLKYTVVPFTTTAENIAQWIFDILKKSYTSKLDSSISLKKIKLWETHNSWVEI